MPNPPELAKFHNTQKQNYQLKVNIYMNIKFYIILANRAPALPVKNLMSLHLLEFGVPWVGLVRLCLC